MPVTAYPVEYPRVYVWHPVPSCKVAVINYQIINKPWHIDFEKSFVYGKWHIHRVVHSYYNGRYTIINESTWIADKIIEN